MGTAEPKRRSASGGGRRIAATVGVVVLLIVTGLPVLRTPAASADELVPVQGPLSGDPADLDDGYQHVVVRFEGGQASSAPRGAVATMADDIDMTADADAEDGSAGTRRHVVVPEVDGVADTAALVTLAAGGRIVRLYRHPDTDQLMAVVERVGGTLASEPAPAPTQPSPSGDLDRRSAGDLEGVALVGVRADDPHVLTLAAVAGTREIAGIGGGWYGVTTSGDRADYERLGGVAAAVEDLALSIFEDQHLPAQWHLANTGETVAGIAGVAGVDVGAADAWAVADGAGIVVAVVDTGMEITHPDLRSRIWTNDDDCGDNVDDDRNGYVDDCHGWDFVNGDGSVDDVGTSRFGGAIRNTHATHVAGIIAAQRGNGIGVAGLASGARVMPVKISDAGSMSMSTAAAAIRYAVDNGADVVNCSFGTTGLASLAQVAPLHDAVRYAQQHGVIVVAAAGNSGRDIDLAPTYPAALPEANVISVGASTNADTMASFSNWGARSVDLFAPGWAIVSTLPDGRYGSLHGTSMASPLVAAAAALALEAHPGRSPAGVKDLLLMASKPVDAFVGRSVSGQRLDVGRILNPTGAQREEPVSFTFRGFDDARPDEPAAAVVDAAVTPDAVPAGAQVAYRATLLTTVAGAAYGVSGAAITTDDGVAVTDDAASVPLGTAAGHPPAEASRTLQAGFSLPAGDYGLVVEARSTLDGSLLGRRWVVFFTVPAAGQSTPPATSVPLPTEAPRPPAPATPTPSPTAPGSSPGSGVVPPGQWVGDGAPPVGAAPRGDGTGPAGPSTPAPGGTRPSTGGQTGPGGSNRAPLPPPDDWVRGAAPPPVGSDGAPPGPAGERSPGTAPSTPAPKSGSGPATASPPTRGPSSSAPPTPPAANGSRPSITLPAPLPPVRSGNLMVTGIEPRSGTTEGGTRVRIDGAGFTRTTRVLFGGAPGSAVTVVSSTVVLVTTPAHAAPGPVEVRVSAGSVAVVLPGAFTFLTVTGPATRRPAGGDTQPPPSQTVPLPRPPAPTTTTTTRPTVTTPTTVAVPPDTGQLRFGAVTTTRGALRLRPLLGPSPLDSYPPPTWGTRRCLTSPCAGAPL